MLPQSFRTFKKQISIGGLWCWPTCHRTTSETSVKITSPLLCPGRPADSRAEPPSYVQTSDAYSRTLAASWRQWNPWWLQTAVLWWTLRGWDIVLIKKIYSETIQTSTLKDVCDNNKSCGPQQSLLWFSHPGNWFVFCSIRAIVSGSNQHCSNIYKALALHVLHIAQVTMQNKHISICVPWIVFAFDIYLSFSIKTIFRPCNEPLHKVELVELCFQCCSKTHEWVPGSTNAASQQLVKERKQQPDSLHNKLYAPVTHRHTSSTQKTTTFRKIHVYMEARRGLN